jgi:NADH-quinone oxidoreductase subunit N
MMHSLPMLAQSLPSMLAPELTLIIGASIVLLTGVTGSPRVRGATGWLALATVAVALLGTWYTGLPERPIESSGLRLTNLTVYVRLIALGIGLVVLLVNWPTLLGPPAYERGDLFAMILFSLSGILLTSMADDLIILFLAIELVSVPTYVLVSIARSDIHAQEAGLKYFFLGALSAALMVYGFSFLYGASGTTSLSHMHLAAHGGYATIGLLLAFAGFSYKIAAVPFHVYAADVYQGAASPITGLLGFFPKAAGFVAIVKLLLVIQPQGVLGAGWDLPPVGFIFLWLVAAATMTVGNVLGLMQRNVKRILAYSSVAHSGYMLIGVLVGPVATGGPLPDGVSAMLFYVAVYGLMNLGAFAVLTLLESHGHAAEDLDDISGLARRQPLAALALAICIFSLMGMPPTGGFFGKVYIFSSALSVGTSHVHGQAMVWLAIIGLLNSAVAAAYYLRILAACYLGDDQPSTRLIPQSGGVRLGLAACSLLVLAVGFWPQGLIRLAQQPGYDLRPSETVVRQDAPGAHRPAPLPPLPHSHAPPLLRTLNPSIPQSLHHSLTLPPISL